MPRWPAGLHTYAGGLPNLGQRNRAIPRPALETYTGVQRQVPLNDGQGSAFVSAGGSATVQLGPSGLGTVWYPAAVTISTTTGALDPSVCKIYAGPAGIQTPTTLLGTIVGGGAGVLAAAVPPLPVGWLLVAVWTGGTPGDVAAVNVTGSKDARVLG
jgi:hypothetical protein